MSNLTPDELLVTTRSVRRRLDLTRPVPIELLKDCVRIAVQAPTGSNHQMWHFIFVTDSEKRRAIGQIYRRAWYEFNAQRNTSYPVGDLRAERQDKLVRSAQHLADHIHEAPALVVACIRGRVDRGRATNAAIAGLYASILPAVWSFMLAARLRGLGTVLTTIHLAYEREVAELLAIDYDKYTQAAMVPVAYHTGTTFLPGPRIPLESVIHLDQW